ncbi:hypothetical protein BKA56DRAFT_572511 [Ilyonectria sp. MPI-CAGE-AT-0026]|nr:hypothetical protein BKA56DRAFT_572511 [Ilyonectria sp. MPI-CAGE-AT-0026]
MLLSSAAKPVASRSIPRDTLPLSTPGQPSSSAQRLCAYCSTANWTLSDLSAALLSALSSGHYVATLLARSKGPPSNPRGLGVGGALGPGHKALSPGESRCACWGLLQGFGTYLLVVDVMEVRRAACEDCCWALAWIGDLKTHHRPGLPLHPGETRALTPASPRRVQVKIRCCVQVFSRAHHSTGFHHEQDNLCQCTLFGALISVGGAVQPAVPPSHGVLGLAAAPASRGDHSAESGYTETTVSRNMIFLLLT